MIHVGVDFHQRFCYTTVLEARGKMVQAGPVTNEKPALRRYFRQFRGQTLCVSSTNRSLAASPQKYLWTGTPVFVEG
jgi:hypothetical protein